MNRVIITGGCVLTATAEAPLRRDVDVVVEDGVIVAVESDADRTAAEIIDASGAIVMPGLVDTHMHVWEYGWRGTVMRKNGPVDYMDLLWKTGDGYTPQDTYESVLGGSMDLLDHGVTGVIDFMHGGNRTDAHTDAAVAAYRETGQRVMLAIGTRCSYTAPEAEFAAARDDRIADIARLRSATEYDYLIDVGTALVTPRPGHLWEQFIRDIAQSREIGARMTFHANEVGEFRRMETDGLLGSDIVPSHGNRASLRELRALAQHGVVLSVSPHTEINSGKSPETFIRAVQLGVRLAIGIDAPPSVMPLNEFAQLTQLWASMTTFDRLEARAGGRYELDFDVDPQTYTLEDAIESATANGAMALGNENLGRIVVGDVADLIVVRPAVGTIALREPAAYIVRATPSANEVTDVIIGGRVRKRSGVLADADRLDLDVVNAGVQERVLRLVDA